MNYFKKSIFLTAIIVLLVYIAASLFLLLVSFGFANSAKSLAGEITTQLEQERSDEVLATVFKIQNRVAAANFFTKFSFWLKAVPVISYDYTFYQELLISGDQVLTAFTEIIEELSTDNLSLNLAMDTIDFSDFFKVYLKHHQEIITAIENLKKIQALSDKIHINLLPQLLQAKAGKVLGLLNKANELIKEFEPFFERIPYLLGQNDKQEILVLLQNTDELRPTGGFIGTIGRVTLNNGVIEQLQTDDVYSIDGQVLGREKDLAPEPIRRYTEVENWYLRDANWSPDFSTSAKDVKKLYEYESGEEGIDTVIAVTPFMIEQLINITGPITVGGIEFNATNLIEALQYRVEQEFWMVGVSQEQRKDIINDLALALQQELFRLTPDQMILVLKTLKIALDQREILVYTVNPALQELIVGKKYDGGVFDIGSDYLYIVDANLGALKTDRVMTRLRDYKVTQGANGKWIAQLTLQYTNNGTFDYRTTRYRTYTRVYVPIGSYLMSATGLMLIDRSPVPGKAEVYNEFNKTVFGGFVSIEPGQTRSVTYTYELPAWLTDGFTQRGQYELFFQKQAGVKNQTLNVDLNLIKPISGFSPSSTEYEAIEKSHIKFSEPIYGNNHFQIQFTPSE